MIRVLKLSLLLISSIASANPPNIVLVISDDMGYSDLGCYGGEIGTPTLDTLAADGLRFTNFYVNNMCWPTRASLLTSLFPKTVLKKSAADAGLRQNAVMLPEALKEAGYKSYMAGKWHLSDAEDYNGPSAPHKRGFDRSYSTYWGTSDFFAPADLNENGESREHEWQNNPDYYYTDSITDYSLKFLSEHKDDSPFFLYVAYNAAHWPLHAQPDDIDYYKGRFSEGWDKLRERRHARMKELGVVDPSWELSPRNPEVTAWEDEPHKAWQERRMEVYAAQIRSMDRNIGRIVDHLKKTGEYENTLFIYQQDNGGCHVEYPPTRTGSWTKPYTTDGKRTPITPGNIPNIMPGSQSSWQSYGYGWANLSNTPFRLYKQHDHEGGTRSPLIITWPAGLDSKLTGAITHELTHVINMMPTLLDAVGLSPKSRPGKIPFEGNSFLSILKGGAENWNPDEELYWGHNRGKATRIGDWKLVSANKEPWELYNISEDGTELNNLAEFMPDKVADLEKKHTAWDKRTNLTGR